jgi:hypothetical protein
MKNASDVLETLRPDPVTPDPTWSQETLTRILHSDTATRPLAPGRRRRLAVVALAAALTSLAGVGVASAGGVMPLAFMDVFSPRWHAGPINGHPPVDPATAKRVATAPGPDGTVFSVLSTGHGQPYSCRTALIESADSAALSGPATFTDVTSSFCSDAPSAPTFGLADISYQDVAAGFIVSAGDAVRAEVRTKDGEEYPALLVEGDFWGWFPTSAHPTLVAFAADGSVVGTVRLF